MAWMADFQPEKKNLKKSHCMMDFPIFAAQKKN